jgi:hypothetical protein
MSKHGNAIGEALQRLSMNEQTELFGRKHCAKASK